MDFKNVWVYQIGSQGFRHHAKPSFFRILHKFFHDFPNFLVFRIESRHVENAGQHVRWTDTQETDAVPRKVKLVPEISGVRNDGRFRRAVGRKEWQVDDPNDGAEVDDQSSFRKKLQSQLWSVEYSDDIDLDQI